MQTFNQSLANLVSTREITNELAISMSSNPDELREMISRGASGAHGKNARVAGRSGSLQRR
jgi:Tfp pilus assembly ATPase PilU